VNFERPVFRETKFNLRKVKNRKDDDIDFSEEITFRLPDPM
jgi:hypothetical protein